MLVSTLGFHRVALFIFGLLFGLYLFLALDHDAILLRLNQLPIEVDRRIQLWDGQDTIEEAFCRSQHELGTKQSIPNIVHFVVLAPDGELAEISYAVFLAVKTAIVRMNATEVKVHTFGLDTDNTWWNQLQDHVTLVEWQRNVVSLPPGIALDNLQLAHQSDLLRLQILAQEGGIYLDTDVFALKPFTDLLDNPRDVLMGHEGGNRYGLCNAVIVARPRSEFITRWRQSYLDFNPGNWNEHSVRRPKQLQVKYAKEELICPLSPSVFFWPTWATKHVKYMYEPMDETKNEREQLLAEMRLFDGVMYENQLAFHGWGAHDYQANLTLERIQTEDTRFNLLVREIAAAPL